MEPPFKSLYDAPALTPPYRIQFDAARDPYAARNAIGAVDANFVADAVAAGGGGGGGAPTTAQYITAAADATLTNERVLTNTATVTWDFTTPGQAKANTAGGGGNVSNSGTPSGGQYAKWVTATTIQGVAPATVLSDIGAQPAGSYQPLDADLTAIAALAGTNTIYYRSAADTWTGVTIGTGLTFTAGTLAASGGSSGGPAPTANVLINSGMLISQVYGAALNSGASSYVVDGWQFLESGAQVLASQQVTDAPSGFHQSLKITVTTANASPGTSDYAFFFQPIEGYRIGRLKFGAAGASSVSLGFWIKANRTGTYSGALRNAAGNRCYPFNFSISVTATWEYKTATITGDTTGTWPDASAVGMGLAITMMAGTGKRATAGAWTASDVYGATTTTNGVAATSDYMQLTGVTIIDGTTPVPQASSAGMVLPFGDELAQCQRYFEKSYAYSTAIGTASAPYYDFFAINDLGAGTKSFSTTTYFVVSKRTEPSVVTYSPVSGNNAVARDYYNAGEALTTTTPSQHGFVIGITGTASAGGVQFGWHWVADARL